MNSDFKKELKEVQKRLCELEKKYLFVQDYDLITSLLNKLDVKEIELNYTEIASNLTYIVERKEDKVIIKKED